MKKNQKIRLDLAVKQKGFAESREKAVALIMTGQILVNEQKIEKVGSMIPPDAEIRLLGESIPFVSRGGMKLQQALEDFQINVQGMDCMDVGASTGGFTDCLLQNGANQIFAIDVGKNELHWSLINHPQVTNLNGVNFRYLEKEKIPQEIDLVVIDLSFISLRKIFPKLAEFCHAKTKIIALFKPQFEVGKQNVEKGGKVNSETIKQETLQDLAKFATSYGFNLLQENISKTPGKKKGNIEILTLWEVLY